MSITPCTSSRRSVFCRVDVAHPRKVEQPLGDAFAAEGLVLDHPQVVANHLAPSAGRPRARCRAARACGSSSDSAHSAIDASGLLISCATPAARKPTLASCSLRTTCFVRSCTWRSRSSRISWKRAVMSFIASASSDISSRVSKRNAITELAGRDAPRAFDQHPQRPKDPGVEQANEQVPTAPRPNIVVTQVRMISVRYWLRTSPAKSWIRAVQVAGQAPRTALAAGRARRWIAANRVAIGQPVGALGRIDRSARAPRRSCAPFPIPRRLSLMRESSASLPSS